MFSFPIEMYSFPLNKKKKKKEEEEMFSFPIVDVIFFETQPYFSLAQHTL
jgi:hypothetical protein